MKFYALGLAALALCGLLLAATPTVAHHAVLAKFDDQRPVTLNGIVTYVDWRNPHAHVFMNVQGQGGGLENWAIELESPVDLIRSGWTEHTVKPGDSIRVNGFVARNGSLQAWGGTVVRNDTEQQVFNVNFDPPTAPLVSRAVPRWEDGTPILGTPPGHIGYWGYPSKTTLYEDGQNVEFRDADRSPGLLRNIADASRVAPFQPWALALYRERQSRFLADDPMYLECKPPGGPRELQHHFGVEFLEHRATQRFFVALGNGNSNHRRIFVDGRTEVGYRGGDDDNPLYYGRSIGQWEGDTLVVTRTGFNEDFWFSNGGLPHTDRLVLTERYTRVDFDTLSYQVTVNDPGAYTRPWTVSWTMTWVPDQDLPRHHCQENRP